jgi:hypothetical protein
VDVELHADRRTDGHERNSGFSHLLVKVPKMGFTKLVKNENWEQEEGGWKVQETSGPLKREVSKGKW